MLKNPAIDEVQEVRHRLIAQHGGLDGYVDYLQQLDKQDCNRKAKPAKSRKAPRVIRRTKPLANPVVDEVREIRKRLVEQHGGMEAYFEYLLELDAKRLKDEAARKARKSASRGTAKRTRHALPAAGSSSRKPRKAAAKTAPAKRTTSARRAAG